MRCATCGHAWHAKLPEEGDVTVAPEDTGLTREQVERLRRTAQENSRARAGPHAEFRAREHAKRKKTRNRVVAIAWATSGVLFLALLGLTVTFAYPEGESAGAPGETQVQASEAPAAPESHGAASPDVAHAEGAVAGAGDQAPAAADHAPEAGDH